MPEIQSQQAQPFDLPILLDAGTSHSSHAGSYER